MRVRNALRLVTADLSLKPNIHQQVTCGLKAVPLVSELLKYASEELCATLYADRAFMIKAVQEVGTH